MTNPDRSLLPRNDYVDPVAAERDFLLARSLHADHTWVGLSSDAMVRQALTGADHPDHWPMDEHDLARCEETYKRAPEHMQPRLLKTLERFRRHIEEGGLYCYGCDNSIDHHALQRGLCRSCWEERYPTESFFGHPPKVAAK